MTVTLLKDYLRIFETINKKFLEESKSRSLNKRIRKISMTTMRSGHDGLVGKSGIINDR